MVESKNYATAKAAFLNHYRAQEDFVESGGLVENRPFVLDAFNNFKAALAQCTPSERQILKREVVDKKQ